jgi:2-polyprenyl-3-methyl-5-hydroxy-6-metoxy-1,4-benzoquinol methylase
MSGSRSHWDEVYTAKSEAAISWYQPHSVQSLQFIDQASPDREASVIDVGGGASTLVDDLLAKGFADIAVLDIAATAFKRSKAHLGVKAEKIEWILTDITRWTPARTWDIWHDRAVFHFLTERTQREAYVAALTAATRPGATVIVSTFALDGPDKCSGLPVQRYSPETLACLLEPAFALTGRADETHITPWGTEQHFSYGILKRQ